MSFNRKTWLIWEHRKPCPSCESGLLVPPNKGGYIKSETQESKEMHSNGSFHYTEYVFSLHLVCSNCKDTVVVSGLISEEDYPSDEELGIQYIMKPTLFYPAPKIINVPKTCPKSVKKTLDESFGLYWLDTSSCANKIRVSIEVLLNELRINKTKTTSSGRRKLSLHQRIILYKTKNSDVASYLLAIKWTGNAGSHFTAITKENILDAYELLEYSLELLYNDKQKKLDKLSKEINRKKKP